MMIESLAASAVQANDPVLLEIARLRCAVWPDHRTVAERAAGLIAPYRDAANPTDRQARFMYLRAKGRVAASCEVFARQIGTTRGEMLVLALAGVCSDPLLRAKGFGRAVVRAAFAEVDRGAYRFSLFQTSHAVRPFYEKLGAVLAVNQVVNSHNPGSTACPFWDDVVMRYPAGEGWPEGPIDLLGPGY